MDYKKWFGILLGALAIALSLKFILSSFKAREETSAGTWSDNWKVNIVPASLNEDRRINLIPGYTQTLNIMLQAKNEVTKGATGHKIQLQLDLPKGIEIIESHGNMEILSCSVKEIQGRTIITYSSLIKNNSIVGEPGARLQSEWNGHFFAIKVLGDITPENMYIVTTITHKDTYNSEEWPIAFIECERVAPLKNTRIGLWDYGMNFTDKGTQALGRFLADLGVNHIQRGNRGHAGYKANEITTGGYIHQSILYDQASPNIDVHGSPKKGDFCDPQAVIDSNGEILKKSIQSMISIAKGEDGMVTVDYEPSALEGFSQVSIDKFKKAYNVTDYEFEQLRDLLKTRGLKSYTIDDDRREIYLKWVKFRTWQTENFARIISERITSIDPGCHLQITTNAGYGDDHPSSIARGGNPAVMGKYIEAIMPQTYRGYGGAETKYAITEIKGWREEVSCKLYPILLIRYAGASPANSPLRVRQQIMGALAEGANGVYLYYPQLMDGMYWSQLSRTVRDIQGVEEFYQRGTRCDELFQLTNMPMGTAEIKAYPGLTFTVENPQWHFTAHERDGLYCITMFNLRDNDDLHFSISTIEDFYIVEVRAATLIANGKKQKVFSIAPEEVAIAILKK